MNNNRRPWLLAGIGLGTAALVTGLATALPPGSPAGPAPAGATAALTSFDDCDALTAWYIQQALPKVTAWGLGGPPVPIMYASTQSRAGEPVATPGAVGNGPTGTNLQEAAVDEPDVAKTMGDYVVSIHGTVLEVTDVSADTPVVVGRLELPRSFWSYELMIVGDRAIVTGSGGPTYSPMEFDALRTRGPMIPYGVGGSHTSITTVDLSDPANPAVVERNVIDGTLDTSREHDGTARVVVTTAPDPDLRFVHPHRGLTPKQALAENRQLVRTSTAADWLPRRGIDRNGHGGTPLLTCAEVSHPATGAGLGTISVLTIDPRHPGHFTATAVSADGSLVYSSADRLYVSTVSGTRNPATTVHAFDTSGATTTYVASGTVSGTAPDRWAFSEQDGLLRVASTLGPQWKPTGNQVSVVAEQGNTLVTVGQIGGIGPGEGIKAVRWFGDQAVVVTFHQVDPLYLLDLTDPHHPAISDELKVSGFSEYLHPVGGSVLLGIGQSANRKGETTGLLVQTFDLADLHRIDRLGFGTSTYSTVETDARAFTYLPDQALAFVPVGSWRTGAERIAVVKVGPTGHLHVLRTLRMPRWSDSVRTLPLDGDRVAIVTGGQVSRIV